MKARKFIYYSYNNKSFTGSEYAKGNVVPYGSKWEVRENAQGQVTSEKLLIANVERSVVERHRNGR